MSDYLYKAGLFLGFCWSLFHLAVGISVGLPDLVYLPVHTLFAIAVAFAVVPFLRISSDDEDALLNHRRHWLDIAISAVGIIAAILIAAYFVFYADALSRRIPLVQRLDMVQLVIAPVLILLVLEATRRTSGMGMVIVVLAFIAYALFGYLMPGKLASTHMQLNDFYDQIVFTTNGVFGVPISISAQYVFYFVLFAAFLEFSGGGRLFIDGALALTQRTRGGPAKAAVVASGAMGMTSGSAVANVMSTGVFTIPLMKAAGYSPRMAAAVEALASTGAQIMPPLMGAAAFIMANTLGVPYSEIIKAAALPALIYFSTVFAIVHFEALRSNLKPSAAGEAKRIDGSYLRRIHLLFPLVYLVYSVMIGRPLMMSAIESMGLVVVVSWVLPATRMWPKRIIEVLAKGGMRVISVAVPCAAAGIVVAIVAQTGIGVRFTAVLVSLSQSSLFLTLVLVMVGCLIMGMGLPTTAAYIMAATLFAPALTRVGIDPLAAHMFVFYYACLSMITPPVALASYAAASVANASAAATGWTAALIGIPLFLIPFGFVSDPALLGQAGLFETLLHFVTALMGATFFAVAIIGMFRVRNKWHESAIFFIGGAALFYPDPWAAVAGIAIVGLAIAMQLMRSGGAKREAELPKPTSQQTQTVSKGE